jgi:hypothetical protein
VISPGSFISRPAEAATSPGLSQWSPGRAGTWRIAYGDAGAAVTEERVIVLNADAHERIPQIKAANPDAVVLVYKNLAASVSSPWAYTAATKTDATFLTAGVGYGYANRYHPEWFLTDPSGQRLEFDYWPGMWQMDIGNAQYQAEWLANVKSDLDTYGWDGVLMDDVNWRAEGNNIPGPTRYATDDAMRAATRSMLAAVSPPLRNAGYLTFANIGSGNAAPGLWADWLSLLDGAEEEHFTKWGDRYVWDWETTGWKTQLDNLSAAAAMGKTALIRGGGFDGDRDALHYALATFFLANDGRSVFSPPELTAPPSYPEFDWDLGQPTGAYRHLGASVYRRDFSAGTVIVNAAERTSTTVELGSTYLDHDGRSITKLTLGPTRGAILRKVGAPAPSTTTTTVPPTTVPVPTENAYADAVLADGPVAYWRLDEPAGASTAADSSGRALDGTFSGRVSLGVPGATAAGTAAAIDQSDGKARFRDSSVLRLNGAFSIEFWSRLERYGSGWPGIVNKNGSWSADGFLIWYDASGKLHFKRNNAEWTTPAGALVSDRLRHFVVTYDDRDLKWYVDGSIVTSQSASLPFNRGATPLDLGQGDLGAGDGSIVLDEVALYGTALSSDRIRSHHEAAGG